MNTNELAKRVRDGLSEAPPHDHDHLGYEALDALVSHVEQLEQEQHRCVFPSCVEGEKPERCGHCGDAVRAEAAEARVEELNEMCRRLCEQVDELALHRIERNARILELEREREHHADGGIMKQEIDDLNRHAREDELKERCGDEV